MNENHINFISTQYLGFPCSFCGNWPKDTNKHRHTCLYLCTSCIRLHIRLLAYFLARKCIFFIRFSFGKSIQSRSGEPWSNILRTGLVPLLHSTWVTRMQLPVKRSDTCIWLVINRMLQCYKAFVFYMNAYILKYIHWTFFIIYIIIVFSW